MRLVKKKKERKGEYTVRTRLCAPYPPTRALLLILFPCSPTFNTECLVTPRTYTRKQRYDSVPPLYLIKLWQSHCLGRLPTERRRRVALRSVRGVALHRIALRDVDLCRLRTGIVKVSHRY
ncbi:hypothetical protein AN958_11014 [Leucoagaricus sp. SymC.cos]|nr:hypothetical protein AN958_11014 [Leucoagaricus sp. SymC.cos]